MSEKFVALDRDRVEADLGGPAPERILSGTPVHRTWNLEDDGAGLYAGFWESTPGEWIIAYTEWEFCHIVSGVSIVCEDGGPAVTLKAGDAFIIRPGFKGRWRVVETTLKHYVVKL